MPYRLQLVVDHAMDKCLQLPLCLPAAARAALQLRSSPRCRHVPAPAATKPPASPRCSSDSRQQSHEEHFPCPVPQLAQISGSTCQGRLPLLLLRDPRTSAFLVTHDVPLGEANVPHFFPLFI